MLLVELCFILTLVCDDIIYDDVINFDRCSASDVAALKQQKHKSSKDTS